MLEKAKADGKEEHQLAMVYSMIELGYKDDEISAIVGNSVEKAAEIRNGKTVLECAVTEKSMANAVLFRFIACNGLREGMRGLS